MASDSHAQHDDHHVNYMAIFWWLLALTILVSARIHQKMAM